MLTTSPHNQNLELSSYVINNKKEVSFNGDISLIKPYLMYGMMNKEPLFKDEFFVERADVDINKILKKLKDKNNNDPVLITGYQRAGKSVIAGRMASKLKQQGFTVFQYDNILSNPVYPEKTYFDKEKLNSLIKALKSIDEDKRVFLFIDELPLNVLCQAEDEPEIMNKPETSILYKLKELLNEHPNLKLVSVMPINGIKLLEKKVNNDFAVLASSFFKEENTYNIDETLKLPTSKTIEMINNALNIAGFNSIPDDLQDAMKKVLSGLDIRFGLYAIASALEQDKERVDNPDVMEDIKPEVWTHFAHIIKQSLIINKTIS